MTNEETKDFLEMAKEIDGMEEDVTSWEAGFLNNVLPRLRNGQGITSDQAKILLKMHEQYFGGGNA